MEEYIVNTVQQHRTKAHLTQQQLADKVGVTRQTIIAVERGKYTPSVLLALKLSETLSVSVATLFTIAYE